MKMKLMILLLTLMASTGCTKHMDFNPWTTIAKEVLLNGTWTKRSGTTD